ncbi:MAG: hypothetical protein R2752_15450 [Vicinamibacterales bacterium]
MSHDARPEAGLTDAMDTRPCHLSALLTGLIVRAMAISLAGALLVVAAVVTLR